MSGTWDLKVVAGSSTVELTNDICKLLGITPSPRTLSKVKEETFVQVLENVRGMDVFIVQSTCYPVNDNIMELLLLIDACKRASARQITVVMPYFAYGGQDRRQRDARHAIGAKLMANMVSTAGAHRALMMETPTGQVQGFFDIPLDHLQFNDVLADYILSNIIPKTTEPIVIVSAGKRSTIRAKYIAEKLNCALAVIDGRKGMAEESEFRLQRRDSSLGKGLEEREKDYYLLGDVKGAACIIVDIVVDHAHMLCEAFSFLIENGAKRVSVGAVHGKFSPDGVRRLVSSPVELIVCSDSINSTHAQKALGPRLHILSSAMLFAEAIRRVHFNEALEEYNVIDTQKMKGSVKHDS